MSKFPRWLRPAIATAAIVAVGAASVVIGTAFAPQPSTEAEPTTARVPVYGPSGYGPTAPLLDLDGDPMTLETSPVQEFAVLPLDEDGFVDLGADDRENAEGAAEATLPDAADWGITVIDDEGSDDPCAPAEGDGPEGCPDGIRGAVFSLDAPGNLWARGSSNVHEPSPEMPNYAVQCEPVEAGEHDLPFGVVANAPGRVELIYYPRTNPADATTVILESTPEQDALWAEQFEAYDPATDEPTVQFCTVLRGLTEHVSYGFKATITDAGGRTFTGTGYFSLPDDRTRPPTIIQPIGDNMLKVSAAHTPDVTIKPSFRVLTAGDTEGCDAPGDRFPIPTDRAFPTKTDLTPEFLAAHDYLPRYTERSTFVTYVPEGSLILVCIGEFEDDRPTWEWFEAQYRTSAIVRTPNYARPILSVDSVHLNAGVEADAVSVTATWGTGDGNCSLFRGPERAGSTAELPEPRPSCGDEEFPITQGDAGIHTWVEYNGGETSSAAIVLLSRVARIGAGPLPETSYFTLPLRIDVDEVRMCGSGVRAPCDPIEAAGAVGTVTIRVDWVEGADNGIDGWIVGEQTSGWVEHELAPTPQVDFIQHQPEIGTIAPRGGPVEVTYLLNVDRPVEYSVTLVGECTIPGEEMTVTGTTSASGAQPLRWLACPGEHYHLTGTLTDEAGNTTVYGPGNPWALSGVTTPAYDTRLAVSYVARRTDMGEWEGPLVHASVVQMVIDGEHVDLGAEGRCMERNRATLDQSHGIGLREVGLSGTVDVTFRVQFREAWGSSGGGEAPICSGGLASHGDPVELHATVPLEDLAAGATITWDEGTSYSVSVTLQDYGPGE